MRAHHEDPVIEKLIGLGERHGEIRAVILTSTRANPSAECDAFSDYDAELYVTDLAPFAQSDAWFRELGPVLVTFREDSQQEGRLWHTCLVLYEDGTKIDFQVGPVAALAAMSGPGSLPAHFDLGYQVLLDKDGCTASLERPTFRAYIPAVPTESEYASLVESFWWDSTYVAKHLWRGDLLPAKRMLDGDLNHDRLRRMLEWSIEIERNWSWRPGAYGKGIRRALDPETYDQLVGIYGGGDLGELWEALFRTTALFRKTAVTVAASLGYEYLHELDRKVTIYLRTVQELDRTASREDLAKRLTDRYKGCSP